MLNDLDINIQNPRLASALITREYFSALQPVGHIAKRHCGNGVQIQIQGESECRKNIQNALLFFKRQD